MKRIRFEVEKFGPWEIDVAQTVYPPREDTELLCRAISRLTGRASKAVEIGCGSGVVSMALSTLGWEVDAYDVNPYAVACSRANIERYGFEDKISVNEGGVGEPGWEIPNGTKLIVWNLPYLGPQEPGAPMLEPIEEASMTDLRGGGWSEELMKSLNHSSDDDLLAVILFRTDPISPSSPTDWFLSGWSCRSLEMKRIGEEKLEVFALWKTGSGVLVEREEVCESAMDRAAEMPEKGWQRVIVEKQISGRGRRGSSWDSIPGDLLASWKINRGPADVSTPGMLQIGIGAVISESLNCYLKWPNDLITKRGEKIGGILIEANSSDPGFRIGIGINSSPREVDGFSCRGWSDTMGQASLDEVFRIVDSRVSGLLEGIGMIPDIDQRELEIFSWKSLSESLSRGVEANLDNERIRIVGIDIDGFLCIEVNGREQVVSDVRSIKWSYPEI
jgi:biotin-(acetyl-CoA carboxylase) ligase